MNKLPEFIKKYLWDADLSKLTPDSNPEYIIEKVLEYGDIDSLKWLQTYYGRGKIIEVLSKSRRISAKSGNFFSLYFNIPKENLECLKHPYTQKQNRF